mgnify:CR=1 FL=1
MFKRTKISVGALLALSSAMPLVAQAQDSPQRVEITGSAIKRIASETALPVQTVTAEEIKRSGVTSVSELIGLLSANQGAVVESTAVGGGGAGYVATSIHNLGDTRTLVLLNGRRLAGFGGQTVTGAASGVDLSSLPLAAIERVEFLTDGASALYGSDAIGGVVNFITKRQSTEGDVSLGYSAPSGGAKETRFSITKGFGDYATSGFNFTGTFAHEQRTPLAATERDFAKTGLYTTVENGTTYRATQTSSRGVPASWWTIDADGNRVGPRHNAYLTANGNCPPNHLASGGACRYDYTTQLEIYPERTRDSLLGTFDFRLSADHNLFVDFLYGTSTVTSRIAPPPADLVIKPTDSLYPAAAVGSGLNVFAPWRAYDFGKRVTEDKNDALHLVVGLEGVLAGWDYNTSYTHSESKNTETLLGGYTLGVATKRALASGVLDPFAEPGGQSAAGQAALDGIKLRGYWNGGKSKLDVANLRASRALFDLPGGAMQLALGANIQHESIEANPGTVLSGQAKDPISGEQEFRFGDSVITPAYSAGRSVVGLFAEANLPLAKGLEATLSGRIDRYSDVGTAATFKAAARWQPTTGLLFRGSVGSGFKAPTVPQVAASRQDNGVTSGNYDCPFTAAQLAAVGAGVVCPPSGTQYQVFAEGNKDLKPEKSRQFSLGFVAEPISGVSVGADLWQVKLIDQISQLDESVTLDPANTAKYMAQGLYVPYKDPSSGLTFVAYNAKNLNLGDQIERGVDMNAKFQWRGQGYKALVNLGATYMLKDEYQLEKGGPFLTSLGANANGLVTFRWQAKLDLSLETGNLTNSLAAYYKSGYHDQVLTSDNNPSGVQVLNADGSIKTTIFDFSRDVSSYVRVDYQVNYRATKQFTVVLGALNIFDAAPPTSFTVSGLNKGQPVGYDPRFYDPRGRTLYVNARYSF